MKKSNYYLIFFAGFIAISILFSCKSSSKSNNYGNSKDIEQETQASNRKDLNLFYLWEWNKSIGKNTYFVSLSDIYVLSENPDSLAIPNFQDEGRDKEALSYFELSDIYRKRFLTNTKIAEEDSLYIFDYSTNALRSFQIKSLKVVAHLSIYEDVSSCPCTQYDYMIGFEVNRNVFDEGEKNSIHKLVYVGKKSPFFIGSMEPIVWQKTDSSKLPKYKSTFSEIQKTVLLNYFKKENTYVFENSKYQFFLQDYSDIRNFNGIAKRQLLVYDKKKKKILNEVLFSESEGSSLVPLNYGLDNSNFPDMQAQWVGKLFKNEREVVLGFEYHSFSCPIINFINSKDGFLEIKCDNRH
jgi:hypothetical protein